MTIPFFASYPGNKKTTFLCLCPSLSLLLSESNYLSLLLQGTPCLTFKLKAHAKCIYLFFYLKFARKSHTLPSERQTVCVHVFVAHHQPTCFMALLEE